MSDVVLNSTLADDFTSIHLTVWMYGSPKSNKRATCAIHVCTSLPSVHDSTRHAAQHGTCIYTVLHWEGSRRQEATNRGGYRSRPTQSKKDRSQMSKQMCSEVHSGRKKNRTGRANQSNSK